MGFLGFFLVALGAEIPDTFQAATAASRGYGSMAISSCFGAQVVNVGLGLGLPWSAATFLGQEVPLVWPDSLAYAAYSQRINACFVLALLMCTSLQAIDQGECNAGPRLHLSRHVYDCRRVVRRVDF